MNQQNGYPHPQPAQDPNQHPNQNRTQRQHNAPNQNQYPNRPMQPQSGNHQHGANQPAPHPAQPQQPQQPQPQQPKYGRIDKKKRWGGWEMSYRFNGEITFEDGKLRIINRTRKPGQPLNYIQKPPPQSSPQSAPPQTSQPNLPPPPGLLPAQPRQFIGFIMSVTSILCLAAFCAFLYGMLYHLGDEWPKQQFVVEQLKHRGCKMVRSDADKSDQAMLKWREKKVHRNTDGSIKGVEPAKFVAKDVPLCKSTGEIKPGDFVAPRLEPNPVPILVTQQVTEREKRDGLIRVGTHREGDSRVVSARDFPYRYAPEMQAQLEEEFMLPQNYRKSEWLPFMVIGFVLSIILCGVWVFFARRNRRRNKPRRDR